MLQHKNVVEFNKLVFDSQWFFFNVLHFELGMEVLEGTSEIHWQI